MIAAIAALIVSLAFVWIAKDGVTVRHKSIDIGVAGVPPKVEIELMGSSAFPVQVEHKNTGV